MSGLVWLLLSASLERCSFAWFGSEVYPRIRFAGFRLRWESWQFQTLGELPAALNSGFLNKFLRMKVFRSRCLLSTWVTR